MGGWRRETSPYPDQSLIRNRKLSRLQLSKACNLPWRRQKPIPAQRLGDFFTDDHLWAYARDDRTFRCSRPPMVVYRLEDIRSGECAVRHLSGHRGILDVDGDAAYDKLARSDRGNDGITLEWQRRRSRADGKALAGRENCARPKAPTHALLRQKTSAGVSQIYSISGRRPLRRNHLRQIKTVRSNPLCRLPRCHLRMLPD